MVRLEVGSCCLEFGISAKLRSLRVHILRRRVIPTGEFVLLSLFFVRGIVRGAAAALD